MKYYECLPNEISQYISTLEDVREIRVRNRRAVRINVAGKWYFVGKHSLVQNYSLAQSLGEVCDDIVKRACNNSVYAYEKMLAQGFFTLEDGCRIGVAGEVAADKIFRKYTSLCFRIPHCINCVDKQTLLHCINKNVVVIGPPNSGKTTFLRDYALRSSVTCNTLVIDERGELFYNDSVLECSCCDVLKWTDKRYALEVGLRALSPDLIVCDEICKDDIPFVRSCIDGGVKLICSAHGNSYDDFISRFGLSNCFDVAVVLNKSMHFSLQRLA